MVKTEPALQETQETRFDPWVRKIPWRWAWQSPPVFLPGESHEEPGGPQSVAHKKLDTTEHLAGMHS